MTVNLDGDEPTKPLAWPVRAAQALLALPGQILDNATARKGVAGIVCLVIVSVVGYTWQTGLDAVREKVLPDDHKILVERDLEVIRTRSEHISETVALLRGEMENLRSSSDGRVMHDYLVYADDLLAQINELQPSLESAAKHLERGTVRALELRQEALMAGGYSHEADFVLTSGSGVVICPARATFSIAHDSGRTLRVNLSSSKGETKRNLSFSPGEAISISDGTVGASISYLGRMDDQGLHGFNFACQ